MKKDRMSSCDSGWHQHAHPSALFICFIHHSVSRIQ